MRPERHVLTIRRARGDKGWPLEGHIRFSDGTEDSVYADERARVIARAQQAIEDYHTAKTAVEETIVLDEFGEVVRSSDFRPDEHSVKVLPAPTEARTTGTRG